MQINENLIYKKKIIASSISGVSQSFWVANALPFQANYEEKNLS